MKHAASATLGLLLLVTANHGAGAADPSDGGDTRRRGYADRYGESTSPPNQIDQCTVELIGEAHVPAMVPGAIESIAVTEGTFVEKDAHLAQLDARESEMDLQLANNELDVAKQQAENDIDQRVATAAYRVAHAEHQSALAANKRSTNAISPTEINQLHFEMIRAWLAIEQAKRDFQIAKVTVNARETQVQAAELAVTRREIKAPIGGVVQEVIMHEGEWVNPGDVMLRIVTLDELKVQGFVNSLDLHPSEVDGKTVTVDVELARGRRVQFTGRIDYVSSEIEEADDYYRVSATVENRKENGHWVLRPGMIATMTIDVGTVQAAERVSPSGTR